MQFSTFRGAVTAAAMVLTIFSGVAPASAMAQEPAPTAAAPANGLPAQPAGTSEITFVAQEVVQPLESAETVVATVMANASSLQQLVGDMPVEPELSPELMCLAQAVYFEARGEPVEGQLAVAEVIINRAESGLYPSDYCGVVTQPAQFSFVKRGRIPHVNESSAAWERARAVAMVADQDLWESEAADALYFHATYVKPSWARRKVQLAQIDTHIFYR